MALTPALSRGERVEDYPLSLWERAGVRVNDCPLSLWERVGVRGFFGE